MGLDSCLREQGSRKTATGVTLNIYSQESTYQKPKTKTPHLFTMDYCIAENTNKQELLYQCAKFGQNKMLSGRKVHNNAKYQARIRVANVKSS